MASAAIADELDAGLLRHLPRDQREAIVAHIIQERDYRQIAAQSRASEASVRQRVSRGLSELRRPLQLYRASQQLAHEGRTYRFGGGYRKDLHSLEPREPLDCSSSASLILLRANLFPPGPAWTSGHLAENWGHPGEGRYVTVWANEEHVWLEFKLDADHGERFDPTPSRLAPNSSWIRNNSGPKHEFLPRHWPDSRRVRTRTTRRSRSRSLSDDQFRAGSVPGVLETNGAPLGNGQSVMTTPSAGPALPLDRARCRAPPIRGRSGDPEPALCGRPPILRSDLSVQRGPELLPHGIIHSLIGRTLGVRRLAHPAYERHPWAHDCGLPPHRDAVEGIRAEEDAPVLYLDAGGHRGAQPFASPA